MQASRSATRARFPPTGSGARGLVGSQAFGCYFDLANVVAGGMDSATEIRALGPLIRRVHFKDARVTAGDCPPGLGWVDFAASSEALDEIGYDGWVVLETPPALPSSSRATSRSRGRSCRASRGRGGRASEASTN